VARRSILTAGAGLPEPRDPGADLDLDLPAAPTRPLTAYSLDALREAEVAR
jgi:hypothetical protein